MELFKVGVGKQCLLSPFHHSLVERLCKSGLLVPLLRVDFSLMPPVTAPSRWSIKSSVGIECALWSAALKAGQEEDIAGGCRMEGFWEMATFL